MENLEKKCVWKIVLEKNLEGKGTSFIDRTKENLLCYECDGSKKDAERLNCKKYVEEK